MTALPRPRPVAERSGVDPAAFSETVLPGGRPVVLRGLVSHWPLVAAARGGTANAVRYLRGFDAGASAETIYADASVGGRFFYDDEMTGLNFERRPARLSDSLTELSESEGDPSARTVYIQSVPTETVLPGLAAANPSPLLPPRVAPRIWIGGPLSVQTHYDLSHNIACVAAGRRRFLLFPPDQLPNLYPGPFELTLAGPPVSMVRPDAPDLSRYPRYAAAMRHAQVADLEPGDALFVPFAWWHHVVSTGAFNVLVNYWWNDAPRLGSPYDALLHAVLAVRDLPEDQRAVWEGMFAHYAFERNGPPVAHLPPHARGPLGAHNERMRARIWRVLANAVGREAMRRDPAARRPPGRDRSGRIEENRLQGGPAEGGQAPGRSATRTAWHLRVPGPRGGE